MALLCDALLGNMQQRVLQGGTSVEMLVFCQAGFGTLAMGLVAGASDKLGPGVAMMRADHRVAGAILLWAVAITVGVTLVMRLVGEFSAVTAVAVTTVRKAATLAASYILFPKPLGWGHVGGAALVFGSAFVKHALGRRKA